MQSETDRAEQRLDDIDQAERIGRSVAYWDAVYNSSDDSHSRKSNSSSGNWLSAILGGLICIVAVVFLLGALNSTFHFTTKIGMIFQTEETRAAMEGFKPELINTSVSEWDGPITGAKIITFSLNVNNPTDKDVDITFRAKSHSYLNLENTTVTMSPGDSTIQCSFIGTNVDNIYKIEYTNPFTKETSFISIN